MTFKDIAAKLNNTVQTVPNLIQVLKDGFQNVEAGGSSGGSLDYGTTEVERGKWIDGKTYYSKCFSNINIPYGGYTTDIDLGLEADTIINVIPLTPGSVSGIEAVPAIYSKVSYNTGNNTHIYPTSLIGAAISGSVIEILYTKK